MNKAETRSYLLHKFNFILNQHAPVQKYLLSDAFCRMWDELADEVCVLKASKPLRRELTWNWRLGFIEVNNETSN